MLCMMALSSRDRTEGSGATKAVNEALAVMVLAQSNARLVNARFMTLRRLPRIFHLGRELLMLDRSDTVDLEGSIGSTSIVKAVTRN